jgi:hypothetical protein
MHVASDNDIPEALVLYQKANERRSWDIPFKVDILEERHVELTKQSRPLGRVQRHHVNHQVLDRGVLENAHCGLHQPGCEGVIGGYDK